MKRLVSVKDEKGYTLMLKVINSIGGRNLNYNWLITDIEAYPQKSNYEIDENLYKLLKDKNYVFISIIDLLDILEKNDFQWIWGVFSAIPVKYSLDEVLKYALPYAEDNNEIYLDDNFIIQHPLSDIEIVAFDSSGMHIVSRDEDICNKFKKVYSNSKENYF